MTRQQIMIVEDEVIVSADLKAKLEKLDYSVPAIIRYGEEVVAAARRHKPDLILMDIRLKGELDGTQAARQIQDLNIPIIFITAYADRETLKKAKMASPFGYLVKPIRLDELRITIEISLYKAVMERRLRESELRFRTVADYTYDWETWSSPENRYLYVSPSCERISGYPPDAFYEDPDLMFRITNPADMEKVKNHFQQFHTLDFKEGKLEFSIIRPDGEERWIEHLCQPVFSPDGDYLGRRSSNRDISCRKKTELERQRLVVELQSALDEVKKLSGLLPICSFCKKIRNSKGHWQRIEFYIAEHSEAEFSHSICCDCAKKHYPELLTRQLKHPSNDKPSQ